MNRYYSFPTVLVALYLILSLLGCSGGGDPVAPPTGNAQSNDTPAGPTVSVERVDDVDPLAVTPREEDTVNLREDRWNIGAWTTIFNPETMDVEIVPNRELMAHINVTNMLKPPSCDDCLGISVLNIDHDTHIFSIQVSLKNPTAMITGYDVRSTLLFPAGDNRELVNNDGFTQIFSFTTSPFKAFAKTEPNRSFGPGATHYEQLDIYFPPPANLTVDWVVDASWPANQEEPYEIANVNFDGGMNECNSAEGWLYADLMDWQGNGTGLTLDLTPLGGEVVEMEHVINQTYRYYLNNEFGAGPGTYDLWITAGSEDTDYDLYYKYELIVEPCTNWPPEWDDETGITDLVPTGGGLEVIFGTATDTDTPVSYNIYWSEDDPIEWTTATFETTDASPYILEGLSDDHIYWVGVRAIDNLGAEEKNTIQLSGTPSNPPTWDDTVGITAVNPMDGAMEVLYGTAHDPQTPVTYNIYYSETTPIDFDTAPSINDTGSPTIVPDLDNFVEYHFAVRAMDAFGSEDQNTNELPGTPNGAPEWVGDIGIQSTIPGHESVTVTYGTAIDIDLPLVFNVYYSETSPIDFGIAPYEMDTDGSPYTVTGLNNDQQYFFAVRAEDSTGLEETNTVELPGTPNAMPTWVDDEIGVQSLVPYDHQVTVHFGEATDSDLPITYYIYYSDTTPIDFESADFETTTDPSPYVVDGLINYQPYFFAVRAEDSMGIMDDNTVELSTIPNPAPIWDTTTGVTSLEPGTGSITVYYGTASDLDMPVTYRVYYSETTPIDFGTAPWVDDPDGSPTVLSPLSNGVPYYIAVRAYDKYGHFETNTVEMTETPMGLPSEVWSVFTSGVVQGSPALVDVNHDMILDVVIGDQANKMVAYNGTNGVPIWTFPTGGWVDSSPAVADLGGSDATPDIVFGGLDKRVYAVDGATGLEIWSQPTTYGNISSPCLANIKGDFHPDVIIGSMDGNVYAFNGVDGTPLWTFPTGAGVFSSPASVDLTDDDIPDFVVGSRDGNVYAIDGNSGLEIWNFPIGEWINSSPALANLNGDSIPDAVIGGMDGYVYAIDGATGTEIWSFDTGSYIWTSPAIGRINGDGVPDVVLGADSADVYAIDGATGLEIWSFPSMDRIWSSAALVDLTDDSIPEAIVGSDDGYLYGIDGSDGTMIFQYETGDWIDSSPAIGDLDNDGLVDIAWGGFDGYVTVVEADFATFGVAPWPMFRQNLLHTALY